MLDLLGVDSSALVELSVRTLSNSELTVLVREVRLLGGGHFRFTYTMNRCRGVPKKSGFNRRSLLVGVLLDAKLVLRRIIVC